MSSLKEEILKVISEYKSLDEEEDVQKLLYNEKVVKKPNILTHSFADVVRELKLEEFLKEQEEVRASAEKEEVKEDVGIHSKIRCTMKSIQTLKSIKTMKSIKSEKSIKGSIVSKVLMKRESPRNSRGRMSIISGRFSQISSKRGKIKSSEGSPEGSPEPLEIVHVLTLKINKQLQQELKCEVGVDVFMEIPWIIVSRTSIINTIKRDQSKSPFYDYASSFEDYPEEEILVGRATLYDCDSFLVAITINGRNMLLNEIKSSHSDKWEKIKRMSNFPVGEWKTLGSEVEIENELIKNSRPFISYDCYIRKDFHEKGFFRGFNCVDYYTELKEEGITMTENVKGVAFHKYAQACPQYQDASAQTVPEIPVNSTTQFSVEMRVMENEENLQQLEVDWEMLNKKFTAFFYKVDMFLTYNEEYDLYRDDYEMLASEGEDISMSPNIPYDHYLTMLTLVGTKGKGITSTSWHPCQPGLIAVAYGKQHVTKVEDLNLNSDEEVVDNDSDEKNVYSNLPTSNQFDEHIENIWKDQLAELENDMKEEKHDTQYYDLAVASIEFMQQAKNIRLFEVIQEKERLHRTPDVEDLYEEEKFVYPLFEGTKKKQKKENEKLESIDDIIDRVMSREPSFLKREHLFSGNFHWKLKMADEVINPLDLLLMKRGGSIPKRYIRTFLFREIWGDSWNFGDDLKYAAIEVNKDFRESALEALGLPTIPDSDILLPGFKGEDIVDYTVELNPSQWTDAWDEHCKFCNENKIPPPTEEEEYDLPETDEEEPFDFLFIRNVPVYDVEYENVHLQYFLCDRKDCHHCQFLIKKIMAKKGRDHVCLKIIMNKENPDEVEEVIMLPYKHVHGNFNKKEEKLVLKKKKKVETNENNEKEIEDEYELPYCNSKSGCLIRRLLPDYLKDSRTKKLFCDQCPTVKKKKKRCLHDNYLVVDNAMGNNRQGLKVKNKGINKISDSNECNDTVGEEECEDAVGQYLEIKKSSLKEEYHESMNECVGSISPVADKNLSILEQDIYLGEEIIRKYDPDNKSFENLIDNNENVDNKLSDEEDSLVSSEDVFFGESDESPRRKRDCNDGMRHERNIVKCRDGNLDKCSLSSSSETESIGYDKNLIKSKQHSKSMVPNFIKVCSNQKPKDGLKVIPKHEACNLKDEKIVLDIKHILDEPMDNSRDFSDRTKKILTEELEKLEHGKRSKIIKRQFEELSSCESSHGLFEHSDDEEELDKLNLVHHVAIWSIANDVKPMRRLVSPFEITSLSFCPYDGRFLAGGTSTGQVVLWDLEYQLEHEECLVQERSDFDLLGFKHLERVMCWFKRLRPDKRIYVTALSHKNKSHMDRIVDVTWLPPSKKISPSGKYEEISPEDGFSFQFMSTSADGVMKFWDLTSSPLPLAEPPNNKNAFTRPGIFKLPSNHQKSKSRYSDLFLRWNPVFQVRFELKDSGAIKKYHLTCISHDHVVYTYEKLITNLNKSETNVELQELYGVASVCTDSMNNETLVGTVDGLIILFSWQLPEVVNEKLQLEGLGATIIRQFKPIHDGPISHISRHPNNNNIFLSSGGHVFALWKINQEGPLKWKRYSNCFITAVGWTQFRPSSFRIGRSDGCIEIWDLHEIGSEPSMVLKVTSGPIYDFTVPTLSVPVGIFGITDHRSILKFYCTPWEHQIARPNEAEEFFGRIEAEHERKMSITKKITDDSDKSKIEDLQKIDELVTSEIDFQQKEADIVKKKEIIGCKKFKEELYKWYLRRRGKNAVWLDESEKKWFKNEEEYMIKTILQNKQIDMKQLDTAIEPLYKKEKHELDVAVKILDVLEMADDIFRHAVQELALVRDYSNKSQVSVEIENMNFGDLHEAMEELDLYFGEAYEKTENELEKFVKNHKITKEWTFVELCEKNQYIRDLWNDKRRLLKPEHKWARELIHEELEKAGYKFSYYINHEESYLRKKYKRRIENIEHLKKKFGNDYDPYWDLHDRYASRTKKTDEFTEEVSDIKGKVQYAGGIFNRQAKTTAMVHPQREVNIVLPKGSFYRKYMPNEKNIKWEKPMVYEERVYSRSKMFKDKLGDSEMTVTSEATVMSSTETDLEGTVEPIYDEDDDENVGTSDVKKMESPVKMSETVERSEEISSSTDTESDENEEKEVDNENEKSRASSVRFKEHENIGTFKPQIDDETKKQPTQFIDLEKEDVSDQFHGIDDLRRIVKEKKLKGEEIIDLDTLKKMVKEKKLKGEEIMDIDDLSVSFESITGSLASSSPSPDMSLKSEDLDIEDWYIDEDSEEEFKEYFEGVPPRYDAPKVVPCDDSSFVDEPTEEWMAEALKPAFKPQEVEEEKSDENEEGPKKPDIQTTAILEKEKAVRDKIEKLELMSESSQIMETFTPLDQSGPKIERIKHVFDKRYSEEDDLPE